MIGSGVEDATISSHVPREKKKAGLKRINGGKSVVILQFVIHVFDVVCGAIVECGVDVDVEFVYAARSNMLVIVLPDKQSQMNYYLSEAVVLALLGYTKQQQRNDQQTALANQATKLGTIASRCTRQ